MLPRKCTALAALFTTLVVGACGTMPADLDLTLQHPSRQGKFMVRLDPPANGPAINQIHAWQIRVSAPDGAPVTRAAIAFDGGMPAHGHGFPTKPRVTGEPMPGVYTLDGVKFSMTGWWDMRLAIRTDHAADTADFNVIVDASGIRR